MLVGGGHRRNDPSQQLEVQLMVGGKIVDTIAGDNAGAMNWKSWEVAQYKGQKAQIKVIPETVDEQFVFAGRPNYAGLRDRVKQLQADEVARMG